jgi:hypothetical protein
MRHRILVVAEDDVQIDAGAVADAGRLFRGAGVETDWRAREVLADQGEWR